MKNLLFVCVENSCRSQMAHAWANQLGNHSVQAYSAGSKPSGQVNPRAIQFMQEVGYDLSAHVSKSLDDVPQGNYAAVITMGCGDECPNVKGEIKEDWGLDDPKNLSDDEFRSIRDEIKRRVEGLLVKIKDK